MKKLLICLLILVIGFIIGTKVGSKTSPNPVTTIDTLYVDHFYRDTLTIEKIREVIRFEIDTLLTTDSIYLPIYIPIETVKYENNVVISKTDTLDYTAYLSGYKASLDSIDFRLKYPNIKQTTIITQKPNFSWSIGLYGGYDFIHSQPAIILGAGLSYNF